MKRILVSVTNDLVTDQRVHKVCTTLTEMNFDVLLIGRRFKHSELINRNYKTTRMKLLFNSGFLFYAEYNLRLFFKLFFLKKDILLANDLDTLLPNYLISNFFNKKLVYDSHELFTEVPELINRPFVQKFWLRLEEFILPKLKNSYTVNYSIAKYYNIKYHLNFEVIRNVPLQIKSIETSSFPFKTNEKKVILYQGSINKGRGLELMLEAMLFIENAIFICIGNGDIEQKIKQRVIDLNLEEKVKFIPRMIPIELQKLTPLADLGISLEEDLGLNYKYALPNKLFDYVQAKIPVLVSNLPEMKQIVLKYNIGEIVLNRNPKVLANQINNILQNRKELYIKQLEEASKKLIWENESKKLIELIKDLR